MKYKLGDICEIVSGSTPKTGIPEYWDGDKKWITPAEINEESYIITDSARKLTELGVKKTGLSPFPEGTVILSSRAPIGKVAIAGCEMYCNQGFKNLICSEKINNRYLYWFLKGNTEFLNSLGRGATFKEVSKQIVSNIEINVPSIAQQEQAAIQLETANAIIRFRKQQLQKLDELVKARFVEMFGDYLKDDRRPLSEVAIITGGLTKNPNRNTFETKMPYLRVANVFYNRLDLREILEIGVKEEEIEKTLLQAGDLLFVEGNGSIEQIGRVAIWDGSIDPILHQNHLIKARFNNEIIAPEYALFYFMLQDGRQQIISKSVSTSGLNTLSVNKVSSLLLPIPPIALQKQFGEFVKRVDKSKLAIQQSLDKLKTLRKSLMQEYYGQGE